MIFCTKYKQTIEIATNSKYKISKSDPYIRIKKSVNLIK